MPKVVEDLVTKFLSDPDFYPKEDESKRKEIAYATANKMHNEGKLKSSFWEGIVDILMGKTSNPVVANDLTLEFVQVNAPTRIEIEASGQGDLLVFHNAILCRAETNKNRDNISPKGIEQLAASIGGRPIDIDHDESRNIGAFTAGRPVQDNQALSVDGFIWADRYASEAEGVKNGTYPLSVEADAETAECSVCHGKYVKASEYCNHLRSRQTSQAVRVLDGLKAKGGAITVNTKPAGTQTNFDPASIYFVASHKDLEASWYDSYVKNVDDLPASDFADSSGRRFPYKIHGKVIEAGWRAAWSAANGGHTGTKDESAIAKLKRDKPAGVTISESMEAAMKIKCANCGNDIDVPDVPSKEDMGATAALKAQLDTLQKDTEAKIAELTSKLSDADNKAKASQADLQAAYTKLTDAEKAKIDSQLKLRRAVLASVSEDDWKKNEKAISEMTEDSFALYATTYNKHQFTLTGRPLMRVPDPSLAAGTPDKESLTL